jgi:internalin A
MTLPPERDQLFISYSHVDRGWVERLQKMIRPLVRSEALRLWDDSQIPAGAKWKVEIEKALASAKVALLLVSDDFLASEFVINKELPPLLRAAEAEGLRILWVCLGPCFYEATPIHEYQAVLPPGEPLEAMGPVQQKMALKTIAGAIRDALSSEVAQAQDLAQTQDPAQTQPRPGTYQRCCPLKVHGLST